MPLSFYISESDEDLDWGAPDYIMPTEVHTYLFRSGTEMPRLPHLHRLRQFAVGAAFYDREPRALAEEIAVAMPLFADYADVRTHLGRLRDLALAADREQKALFAYDEDVAPTV